MASLTVDELKKTLTENGVDLPSGRTKKEDYVKLYEEHVALNPSLGAAYSSDDEGSQNSRKVTSTNGEDSSQGIDEALESLSNDDIFVKLKELGYSGGPVVDTTRRVYVKKLYQLMRGERTESFNGGANNSVTVDPSEISDNEVEIGRPAAGSRRSMERNRTPQPSTTKRESSREPVSAAPPPKQPSIPRRISYIEKIPRGTSQRIIEPMDSYAAGPSSMLRQRTFPDLGGDRYVGRWSPSTSTSLFNAPPVKSETPASMKKPIILAGKYLFIPLLLVHWLCLQNG